MPIPGSKNEFIPPPIKKSSFNIGSWGKSSAAAADSAARAASGKTRRMTRDEGAGMGMGYEKAYESASGESMGTGTAGGAMPEASAGRRKTRQREAEF